MVQATAARLLAIVFLLAVILQAQAWAAEGGLAAQPQESFNASAVRPAEDQGVERLLDAAVSYDSDKKLLNELVALLAQHKIDAVLDYRALEEAGIGSDTSLRPLAVSEISLRSVLDLLLEYCDLTYFVRDGKLLITTTDVASEELVVRVYPVADLVRRRGSDGGQFDDYDSLVDLITTTVRPASWDEVGGPGAISEFQGTLVLSQTDDVHAEITQLLAALRASRAQQMAGNAPEPIWVESAADRAARLRFVASSSEAADFEFVERTLHEATAALAGRFGVQVVLDLQALDEAGIASDTPVTAELRKVTLPVALDLVLRPLDMTYVLKDEVVLLTTSDVASEDLSSVVYPVADLVQYGPPQVGVGRQDFNSLIGLIMTNVRPDSWDQVGGPATVYELGSTSSLVISQTREPHDEIIRLLAGLRKLRSPLAQPPRIGWGGMGGMGGGVPLRNDNEVVTTIYKLAPKVDVGKVIASIREIDAESWNQPSAHIRISAQQLVVRNTRRVQRQVANQLTKNGTAAPRMGDGMGGGGGGGMF